MTNIIICDFGEKKYNEGYENYIRFYDKPYMLMDCKYLIPNFFSHIILTNVKHTITNNDILTLYNMLFINGVLTCSKQYKNIFKAFNVEIESQNDVINVRRLTNITYNIIKKKRAIFDCIIVGAQKASTTSALINLLKHNDVGGHNEEIHFFDIYWQKGLDYLKKYMDKYDNKKVKIIKNPALIYVDSTFPLIQSINPFCKFILLLRNPIDRAYSSWQMVYNNKWTKLSFEESIKEELEYRSKEPRTFYTSVFHYLSVGLYYKQIKRFLKWFPRQSLKIYVIEQYQNHANMYDNIFEFLNIESQNIDYSIERVGSYREQLSDETKEKLKQFYSKDIKKIEKFLGYETYWL